MNVGTLKQWFLGWIKKEDKDGEKKDRFPLSSSDTGSGLGGNAADRVIGVQFWKPKNGRAASQCII